MKTIVIRNNTDQEQIWLKTFVADEEYTLPNDNTIAFKYANLDSLLTAIAVGDASIGNGEVFFTSVAEQINYLKGLESPKDTDGAGILRIKAAKQGWTYQMTAVEFSTSAINSLHFEDCGGNPLTYATVKYYDSNGTELTTQGSCDSSCVKTVIDFEPPWDYEIIGGTIKSVSAITENVRLWVVAVPDIAAEYGGSKVMIQDINLKFVDPNNGVETDGRAAKYLTYSATYHTNKLRAILKHPAGHKVELMIAFELYKA